MANDKPNYGVNYGIIYGVASVIFTLALYLGGVKWFTSPVAFLGYVIPIVIAVLGGLRQKKANGGYLSFKEALKTVFLVFIVGSFIATLFSYVLFNFIDVPFRQALSQESAAVTENFMKKFNAPQDQIDKAVEDALNGNSFSIGKMLLGFAFFAIFWFVISLIIAAIIKRNRPVFDTTQTSRP